jgi:hypothetical protein
VDEKLHVVFSMDCLPAGGRGEVRGPARWDEAAFGMTAFAEAIQAEGFSATFFICPTALGRVASAVGDLRAAGAELGLLCHPQLLNFQSFLGSYSYDRQREIVGTAKSIWEDALGEPARTFRAGFFSANDYTYHVLCMEGFGQGSCSLPGRMDGEQCSMWFGSYPFAHHTDPLDRTQQGTMEFYEVPVTSDFEAATYLSYETYTPPHLRIEEPDVHDYARKLMARQVGRMREEEVPVRTVTFVTSNVVGWGRPDDPHTERLHNLCVMLRELGDDLNLDVQPASLDGVHQLEDEAVGARWDAE